MLHARMKGFLNDIRNILIFKIKNPWIKHGKNIHCQYTTFFWSPNRDIVLGDNVGIGGRCVFLCDVKIGSKVLIAPRVSFLNATDHRYDIVGKTIWDSGRGADQKIVIEDDVWIGHGSILLSPARIGRGSIVAAGSIVNRDVPPYSIVGGCPAKVIKMRFTEEQIVRHEQILYGSE